MTTTSSQTATNDMPKGVRAVAELLGTSADDIWSGTTAFPGGLKAALDTQAKIDLFNTTVEAIIHERRGKMPNDQLAHLAMRRAGDAILGTNRPAHPASVAGIIEDGIAAGILRRV